MLSFLQSDSHCDSFAPDVHIESYDILLTSRLSGQVCQAFSVSSYNLGHLFLS